MANEDDFRRCEERNLANDEILSDPERSEDSAFCLRQEEKQIPRPARDDKHVCE